MALIAARNIPGSTVRVELHDGSDNSSYGPYYIIGIDGEFYDGGWCSIAEGIDRLINPFNVKRVISSAEGYDVIDGNFPLDRMGSWLI